MRTSKFTIFLVCVLLGLTLANFASAALVNCGRQLPPSATAEEIKANECTIKHLITLVVGLINFLLSWAYLVAILFIVWSGWNMATSGGNEEALSAAKTSLRNAVIGFFMIMVAFVLLNFVVSVLTGSGDPRPNAFYRAFNILGPFR